MSPGGPGRQQRSGRAFTVSIRRLRQHPGRREEIHLAGPLGGLLVGDAEQEELGEIAYVPAESEVSIDGHLESSIGGVTVAGLVRAGWRGTCRRCAEEASGTLEVALEELCLDPHLRPPPGAEGEDAYLAGPDELDLEPIVRDACILELPLAPLCSESCRGLCPQCGTNRNLQQCTCEEPPEGYLGVLAGPEGGSEGAGKDDKAAEKAE